VRIAVVSRWYPLAGSELAGVFVREQVEAMRPEHDISVVVPSPAGPRHVARFMRSAAELGAEAIVPLPRGRLLGFLQRAFVLDRALSRVSGGEPDLVHVHLLAPDALPVLLACRRRGIPLVVTEHAGYLAGLVRDDFRARLQVRLVLRYAHAVVAVGSRLGEAIASIEPRVNLHVVGNAIDTGWFAPAPSPRRDHALTVSITLDAEKGIDALLQVWANAPALLPRLVIVGHDPGSRFSKLADELEIGDRVEFRGVVGPEELRRLMQHAAYYVCASRAETFGVAVAEALACGTPVVCTRCGGPEDFVTDTVGLTVPVGDAQALRDAVVELTSRSDGYDPALLHDHIVERFGYAAFRRRMNDVYDLAVARATRAEP
jgi:glycosyltransferase involved in cell wall biosynthesis